MSIKKVTFSDWSGGLNTTRNRGALPPDQSRRLLDLLTDEGTLRYPGGATTILTITAGHTIYEFLRYASSTGVKKLLYVASSPTNVEWRSYDEATTTDSLLYNMGAIGGVDVTRIFMVQAGDKVFCTSGGAGKPLLVWTGSGSARTVGLVAPTSALTANPGGGGQLNSGVGDAYRYVYTYSRDGVESNPSPISTPSEPVEQFNIISIPAGPIANGDLIRLYRIGGSLGDFRGLFFPGADYTFTALVSGGLVYDVNVGTGSLPIDNYADDEAGDTVATYSNALPPNGFTSLLLHQNRLTAAGAVLTDQVTSGVVGNGTQVWVSRPNAFEQWGVEDNGADDDGGYVGIDNNTADPILTLASSGSLLMCGRVSSVYSLYGDGFNTYAFDKRSNIGVAGPRSMTRQDNSVIYLGADKMLYQIGNAESEKIAIPIEKTLRSIGDQYFPFGVVWYHSTDKNVYVAINTGSFANTFALDTRTSPSYGGDVQRERGWHDRSDARYLASVAKSLPPPAGGPAQNLLVQSNKIVSVGESGTATYTRVAWQSDFLDYGKGWQGRPLSLYIEGEVTQNPSVPIIVTVSATQKDYTVVSYTYPLSGISGTLLNINDLPARLVGLDVFVSFDGEVSAGYIDFISLTLRPLRQDYR